MKFVWVYSRPSKRRKRPEMHSARNIFQKYIFSLSLLLAFPFSLPLRSAIFLMSLIPRSHRYPTLIDSWWKLRTLRFTQRRATQPCAPSPRARLRHLQTGNEIASGFTSRKARDRGPDRENDHGHLRGCHFSRRARHEQRGGENPSISTGSRRVDPRTRYSAHASRVPTLIPSDEWLSRRRRLDTVHRFPRGSQVSPERSRFMTGATASLRRESDPPRRTRGTPDWKSRDRNAIRGCSRY